MGAEAVLYDVSRQALIVLLLASLPALVPALAIGLVIGLFQAATSIQEATLTFVPKLFLVVLCLILFGGISSGALQDLMRDAAAAIPAMAR